MLGEVAVLMTLETANNGLVVVAVCLILWVFRRAPRRLTRVSDFRRRHINHARRQIGLMILMSLATYSVGEMASLAAPGKAPHWLGAAIFVQSVAILAAVRLEVERRRRRSANLGATFRV